MLPTWGSYMNVSKQATSEQLIVGGLRRLYEEGGSGNFAIFTADVEKGYYVQFAGARGDSSLWAEAMSNQFLDSGFALDAGQLQRLRKLGWDVDGAGPNCSRSDWSAANDDERWQIAAEVVRTLREVYGFRPEDTLEVNVILG